MASLDDHVEAMKFYHEGNYCFDYGVFNAAIECYNKSIKLDPDYANVYYNRGLAHDKLHQYDKAIKNYTRAIEIKAHYADAYYNRGVAFDKLGEHGKTIEDLTQAIEINPDYAPAYYNRGNAYSKLREHKNAIEDYTQAIKFNPDHAMAYGNRGNAYNNQGEYAKAIEDYEKAIELNPDYTEAYHNRGKAYSELKKYDKAIEDYEKIPQNNPYYESAQINIGKAEGIFEGEKVFAGIEDAKRYGDKIADLEKRHVIAKRSFRWMVFVDIAIILLILIFTIFSQLAVPSRTDQSKTMNQIEAKTEAQETSGDVDDKVSIDGRTLFKEIRINALLATILALCLWLTRYYHRRIHESIQLKEEYEDRTILLKTSKVYGEQIKVLSKDDSSPLLDSINQVSGTLNKTPANSQHKKEREKLPVEDLGEQTKMVQLGNNQDDNNS